ncbi:MAG: hypothetical protein ABF295_02765, partial [Flavobacteriaceae bacterium]
NCCLPLGGCGYCRRDGIPNSMKSKFEVPKIRIANHRTSDKASKVVLLNTLSNYSIIFVK